MTLLDHGQFIKPFSSGSGIFLSLQAKVVMLKYVLVKLIVLYPLFPFAILRCHV